MMSGFCAAKARVSSSVLGSSVRTLGSSSLLGSSTDHPLVEGARAGEIGLGLLDVGAGARQTGFGLGDVGARHLADLEAVAGGLQLALQALLVVEREIEHDLVAKGRGVGVDARPAAPAAPARTAGPAAARTRFSARLTCAWVPPPA